jgi:hypothetical protein
MLQVNNKAKQLIAILLLLSFAISIATTLPISNAQTDTKKTYAFVAATPNPVGVNQEVLIHVGISEATSGTTAKWTGLTVTVTDPDGKTSTLGPFSTDSTGGTGTIFIPTKEGIYKLQSHFPAQDMGKPFGAPGTIHYLASDSQVIELVVQAEPIPYHPGFPLPTEYWTRPVNLQFSEWAPIMGNWLYPAGSYTMPPIPKLHGGNEDAPETAHILWTRQYELGGLTGGDLGDKGFEMGDAYEGKFLGAIILNGVLYYNKYEEQGGSAVTQEVCAVNLKTGEELWTKDFNNTRLDFGQVFYWDSFNYYGAFGYLIFEDAGSWKVHDPLSGRWLYTINNVPSGFNLYGPKGEIYRYTVNTAGGWMTLWNSSRAVNPQNTGSVGDGSWEPIGTVINGSRGYEWNKTIEKNLPGSVAAYSFDNMIFGSTAMSFPGATGPTITSWAISTKIGDEGRTVFKKTWNTANPDGNVTWVFTDTCWEDEVFIISAKETLDYYGFSLKTGELLWKTEPETYLAFYDKWYGPAYGYGKFYTGRMTGRVTCYDLKTGEKLWTYNVSDPYNEILWSDNFPIEYHFLTDGKIYLSYGEHSPNLNARGAPMVCLNATTGEEIWKISWFNCWWGGHVIIGDSVMAGLNAGYDSRIYAFGKGPSATTVAASPKISTRGTNVLVEGFVTDISPGTKDYALTARFPNGVPAVSDENMTEWMQYVHMQYPRPADKDIIGVDVTISVIDPNGNVYDVATATSDASGFYSCVFEPEVPGKYTILASFTGSKSYYGSFAETAINVEEATATEQPTVEEKESIADMYFIPAVIAIIVAIAIATVLILRKKQ